MQADTFPQAPWYKVKIVWLVLGILSTTVAGCMLTIYLAVTNPDPVYRTDQTTAEAQRAP